VQIVNSGGTCTSSFCFQPPVQTAAAGDTVTWTNGTFAPHTVTRCDTTSCSGQGPGTGADTLGSPPPNIAPNGGTYAHTFSGAGTYFYFCAIHGYATMHGEVNVAAAPTTIQDSSTSVAYNNWRGVIDATANGGTYRTSPAMGAHVTFKFSGTAITLVARKGPDQGMASVTIDGVSKGSLDLFAASAQSFSQNYPGLASGTHTIVVTVTGTKNASSTGTNVAFDAFVVGSTTTQDSSPKVSYDTWKGVTQAAASGGTYRDSSAKATSSLTFTGTQVDWITATGPSEGMASVSIDGVGKGTVDLFAASMQWQVVQTYSGLGSGSHTMVVTVLHTKNPSSTGTHVVVDAYVVHA
jgi:plastocyanin